MSAAKHEPEQVSSAAAVPCAKSDRATRKASSILDAARALFLEQGYEASSVEQVARKAGVSKATLYVHFESKEALLLALVRDECRKISIEPPQEPKMDLSGVKNTLQNLAKDFTACFLSQEALAFHRLMMAQTARFPDIGRVFYEEGPLRLQSEVADFLESAQAQGLLSIGDIDLAVIQFISLVRGDLPFKWALSMERPSDKERQALIDGGIEVFLAAYSRRPEDHGNAER
jgi:TetR/AcrR family transcriptional regulator, mexJK operon transcriptional repressor